MSDVGWFTRDEWLQKAVEYPFGRLARLARTISTKSVHRMNNRILRLIIGVGTLLAISVIGYMLIENWTFLDALYMTAITLSTVGFGEIHPLSDVGRMFTVLIVLAGVGIIAYSASLFTSYLFEAGFAGSFRRRRMERQLQSLENHVIVVGYGRVGRKAAQALLGEDRYAVVVVDEDQKM